MRNEQSSDSYAFVCNFNNQCTEAGMATDCEEWKERLKWDKASVVSWVEYKLCK